MAKWISQREVPSVSARSRKRTAYLETLRPDVVAIVTSYVEARPNAEDVTLEVLGRLGRERLTAAGGNDLKRLRQDVGLLVAQSLVDVFGEDRVLSLRADDGVAVSTRRNTRDGLEWVARFTPHRVLPASTARTRILLDTVTVRKIVHGDADALDLSELGKKRGEHPVSIADGGLAELATALIQERLPIDTWSANIAHLDAVLDPLAPVFPGGLELATLAGLRDPPPGYDTESSRMYYRAAWEFLRNAKSKRDLERTHDYVDAAGRRFRLRLDRANAEDVLADAGDKWTAWVISAGKQLRSIRGEGEDLDVESLRELVRTFLMLDGMTAASLDKIDVAVRVIALRTIQAGTGTRPYRPNSPNDALDFDLLFGIPLPAIICTSDSRLVRLVAETGSADVSQVMLPAELLRFL